MRCQLDVCSRNSTATVSFATSPPLKNAHKNAQHPINMQRQCVLLQLDQCRRACPSCLRNEPQRVHLTHPAFDPTPAPRSRVLQTRFLHHRYGAVAATSKLKNPIRVAALLAAASAVEEDPDGRICPTTLVGGGAHLYATARGVETVSPVSCCIGTGI